MFCCVFVFVRAWALYVFVCVVWNLSCDVVWCVYLWGVAFCVLFILMCLCAVCGLLRGVVWFLLCVCFVCACVCDSSMVCCV